MSAFQKIARTVKMVVVSLGLVGAAHAEPADGYIGPVEFLRLSQKPGAVVLDVRDSFDREGKNWVYRNAKNLPAETITAETAAAMAPDKSAPTLLLCNFSILNKKAAIMSRRVPATAVAMRKLKALGYTNIYALEDGASKLRGFDKLPITETKGEGN